MLGAGVYMAAGLFFPPAMAILPGLQNALGGALASNNPLATFLGLSGISGMNVLSGFVPQKRLQMLTHMEYRSKFLIQQPTLKV